MSPVNSLLKQSTVRPLSSAEGYDRAPEYYDSWAWQDFWRRNEFPVVLAQLLDAAPTRAILDLGVGTGAFYFYAGSYLPRRLRMIRLDISFGMLARAQSRLSTRVELPRADLQQTFPFRENSFDAVIMMRAANHIRDLDAVASEIGRVLCPGGIFLATDLADEYDYFCTRIPTANSKVYIETFKHSQTDWTRALEIQFCAVTEYRASQLKEVVIASNSTAEDIPVFKFITARRR